jgi:Mn-containing catalase
LVDQYFNASTGQGDEGETDQVGPWNKGNGLHIVQSDLVDGKSESLNTKPYMPQPGTEVTSSADSTPVGEHTGAKNARKIEKPQRRAS